VFNRPALVHGVRNPLNTIKGAVTYLGNKYEQDPVFVEFTDIIQAEIMKLDDFITKFLRSSLTNRENAETDINELLRNVQTLVSVQTRSKQIQADFEYGDLPPIITNYFLIEQAVLNIINNAVEAMPSGGKLSVRSYVETFSEDKHVLIEIADSGSGIDTKKISDLSAYLGDDGKGFGLFLTREILNYYGGHLVIKSNEGQGTTVKLYIPVQKITTKSKVTQ
jgi:two-component system nitrogen regulation sensor histidine kinase GlnL